jgi:N-acetylneuraminic acid mutarotase
MALLDNVVAAHDGKVYTVGGVAMNGVGQVSLTKKGWVLDPRGGGWQPIADQPTIREKANGAFIGGKLYVTGGWAATLDGSTEPGLDIYDPRTDTWTSGTTAPVSYAAAGVATLDGKLYLVGGCHETCGSRDVWVYTPSTDRWQKAASYPEATSWASCGAIAGKLYCAGGANETEGSKKTFVYDPATNAWTRLADMVGRTWGAAYSAADGLLIVSGGASGGGWINMENYAYDPVTDTWSELPMFDAQPTYRGGGACGFYHVGGGYGEPGRLTRLPGFDVCDGGDGSWLTLDARRLTVEPGEMVTVTVTLDAGSTSITQPGDLAAEITLDSDTPYRTAPVDVALRVDPPKSWGKVTGTVTGVDCDGQSAALAGAAVQIRAGGVDYALLTDRDGRYSYWLDRKGSPATVTVAKDDYESVTRQVKFKAGQTTTHDVVLTSSLCVG